MAYFKIRLFEDKQITKIAIVIISAVVLALGVIHFGYASTFVDILNDKNKGAPDTLTINTNSNDYAPQAAYFIISGVAQIVISVLVALAALEIIIPSEDIFWKKILFLGILSQLLLNFAMFIYASITGTAVPYDNGIYQAWAKDNSQASTYSTESLHELANKRFTLAEAVLLGVVALPLITITLLTFIDGSLKVAHHEGKIEIGTV